MNSTLLLKSAFALVSNNLANVFKNLTFAVALVLLFLPSSRAFPQVEALYFKKSWPQKIDKDFRIPDEMLWKYFDRELDKLWDKRKSEMSKLTTPDDWENRKRYIREKVAEVLGELPEKTPLNSKIVGIIEDESFWIEKLIFESRPGFFVTANVYVPKNLSKPAPVLLNPCGHSLHAKASGQIVPASLAKQGYIVLIYDPLGQGERSEYWNPEENISEIRVVQNQHCAAGFQCFFTGVNIAQYRIWDGIRAIDYLVSRPDVDPERIAVAGISGGGTMSTYIAAMDPRVKLCNPVCYITTLQDRIKSRLPVDDEQDFHNQALYGIDQSDLLSLVHPNPILIGAANFDHFPVNGTVKAYAELKHLYYLTGVPDRVGLILSDTKHAWNINVREALYDWLNKWFRNNPSAEIREGAVETRNREELYCTASGQVSVDLNSETVFSLNKKFAEKIIPEIESPQSPDAYIKYKERMIDNIKRFTAYKLMTNPMNPVIVSVEETKEYRKEKVVFESEEGIYIPGCLFLPNQDRPLEWAVIYVPDVNLQGKKGAVNTDPLIEKLACNGICVIVIDVRGVGETVSRHDIFWPHGPAVFQDPVYYPETWKTTPFDSNMQGPNNYYYFRGNEYEHVMNSLHIGRPLFGMRVIDIVRTVDYLDSRAETENAEVCVLGRKEGALLALHAAALDDRITTVIADEMLSSYRSLVMNKRYKYNHNLVLHLGVLKYYDIADVASVVAPKRLVLSNPVNHMKEIVETAEAQKSFSSTSRCYEVMDRKNNFELIVTDSEVDLAKQFLTVFKTDN
jgi:cephalosporin-C deacetylase-like acetyl esterase